MRLIGALGAIVMAGTATATVAQSASQAFECALPYREAMESLASLEVTGQEKSPGSDLLMQRPSETIKFSTDSLSVFGVKPTSVSLVAAEPLPSARNKIYQMNS